MRLPSFINGLRCDLACMTPKFSRCTSRRQRRPTTLSSIGRWKHSSPTPFTFTGGLEFQSSAPHFDLHENAISTVEEQDLLKELEPILKRRRYEAGHFDKVIFGFREIERASWKDPRNASTIEKVRSLIVNAFRKEDRGANKARAELLPAVHVIDLKAGGKINAHVDSVN